MLLFPIGTFWCDQILRRISLVRETDDVVNNESGHVLTHQGICFHCRCKTLHPGGVKYPSANNGILKRHTGQGFGIRVENVWVIPRDGFDYRCLNLPYILMSLLGGKTFGHLHSQKSANEIRQYATIV